MDKKFYCALRLSLKYVPIAGAMIMWVHVVNLWIFQTSWQTCFIAEWLAGFSMLGVVLLMLQAYVLHFCRLYKSFVIYDAVVYNCIIIQRYWGFGEALKPLRLMMLVLGVMLFAILVYNIKRFNRV